MRTVLISKSAIGPSIMYINYHMVIQFSLL